MTPADATILHADLDAFYASVEQLFEPKLRGRPIAVGGGIVLAASYEAKAFGVRGGMAGREAKKLCPELIFVPGRFDRYQKLGDAALRILEDYTPLVERVSIDEAFADVAGTERLFGPPPAVAAAIRQRVRAETGLPISIGVARTKHLAKIGSQVAKPDGLCVIEPANELTFLHGLPVDLMWGVGPVTKARLARAGVTTIGALAALPGRSLESLVGTAASQKLAALACNRDPRTIAPGRRVKSVSAQAALGRQIAAPRVVAPTLRRLADRICTRLRNKSLAARTIGVRLRFADMRAVTRAITLEAPVAATGTVTEIAEDLVWAALAEHASEHVLSLLAIAVSHLEPHSALQLELPLATPGEARRPGSARGAARWRADRAMDQVRDRFGWGAIGYGSVAFDRRGHVPDAFRELAEKEL